jgi:hypothetical protein
VTRDGLMLRLLLHHGTRWDLARWAIGRGSISRSKERELLWGEDLDDVLEELDEQILVEAEDEQGHTTERPVTET